MEFTSGCDAVIEDLALSDGLVIMLVNSGGWCLFEGLEVEG